jgi:N-acetylglutamate synthase-like GNAT family acetyltransferase
MFVTRAGRHDKSDLKEFIEARRGGEVDISEGTAMIAREGSIVGCIRLIEVESGSIVYDDVLIAEGRDEAVAKQLIQAAMNNQGGPIFTAVQTAKTDLFSSFGFAPIDRAEAPASVGAYWSSHQGASEGLVYLKAR